MLFARLKATPLERSGGCRTFGNGIGCPGLTRTASSVLQSTNHIPSVLQSRPCTHAPSRFCPPDFSSSPGDTSQHRYTKTECSSSCHLQEWNDLSGWMTFGILQLFLCGRQEWKAVSKCLPDIELFPGSAAGPSHQYALIRHRVLGVGTVVHDFQRRHGPPQLRQLPRAAVGHIHVRRERHPRCLYTSISV